MRPHKKPTASKPTRGGRQQGVYIRIAGTLNLAVRERAAARRLPLKAIDEKAVADYWSPGAQDQRDAMLARQFNRLSRGVESVDGSMKLRVAMMRYQSELDLSFLPDTGDG
jgi:hypothetical protein